MALTKVDVANIVTGVLPVANGGTGQSNGSLTPSGNLAFSGTGNRITGDFSNATVANRVAFQTSTTNDNTFIPFLTNGTGASCGLEIVNSSDNANGSILQLSSRATDTRIASNSRGSGTALPLTMYTGGSERLRIDTSGNVGIGTSSGSARLNVNGGSGTSQIRWEVSNASYTQEVSTNAAANAYVYKSNDASYHIWKLSNSEAMRLDSSGNLGIGTSSPAGKLDVKIGSYSRFYVGSGLYEGVIIGRRVADDSYATLQFVAGAATNPKIEASGEALDFYTNNTYRGGFDVSGNFKFNSGYGSAATAYGCRVWVSFTASSGAIRGSGNVSSVTRNGTGDYTVNFTNAMPDANYAFTTALKPASNQGSTNGKVANVRYDTTPTTTACRLWCYSTAGVEDFDIISLVVFR